MRKALFLILAVAIFSFVNAQPSYMGHTDNEIINVSASKILPGQLSGNFVFPQNLEVQINLYVEAGELKVDNDNFNSTADNLTAPYFYGNGSGLYNIPFPAPSYTAIVGPLITTTLNHNLELPGQKYIVQLTQMKDQSTFSTTGHRRIEYSGGMYDNPYVTTPTNVPLCTSSPGDALCSVGAYWPKRYNPQPIERGYYWSDLNQDSIKITNNEPYPLLLEMWKISVT